MNVWRLEWLRLVRTRRLLILLALFVLFGATAAPIAYYSAELAGQQGITLPAATPATSVGQFSGQATVFGLIVFSFIVSAAVSIDANRESSIFLRTRVRRLRDLLVPKYVMSVGAGVVAIDLGIVLAWFGTVEMVGAPSARGMVVATALTDLYFAFVGALVLVAASRTNNTAAAAAGGIGGALLIAIAGIWRPLGQWLPSELVGSLPVLAGGASASDYVRATVITVVATVALVALALHLFQRREL